MRQLAPQQSSATHVSVGSKTVLAAPKHHFRSTPINGHRQTGAVDPVRANFGSAPSLDDKVCGAKQCCRKFKVERFCGLEVEG
jgi:hypothetical protein